MVVLAASIVSKSGKALVSRQYMDMSRIRIEGLLAAFPKLVGSGKQHTYVETENVRYVYQPIEGMFLLLVTNRGSNILEDLDTLRLLSKLVPEYAGGAGLDEEAVSRAAFDLVFAFDEVISHGHKENITVQQVKQNCEMESHEEKLHKMIIQSKINDTKDIMKRKAQEIDKHKIDAKRALPAGPGYNPAMAGLGGGGMGSSSSMSRPLGMDMDAGPSLGMPGLGSGGGFGGSSASAASAAAPKAGLPKKGMQLGKGKGAASILESLAKEEGVASLDEPSRPSVAVGGAPVGTQVISGESG
uniref:Coatomer subunit delta n=1 Tax=Tetradesmus obliquus TaxID=3088 RepID=A0A383VBM7_TETOB|eukprot:jgi/Sobl393_1/12968/SZX62975.1